MAERMPWREARLGIATNKALVVYRIHVGSLPVWVCAAPIFEAIQRVTGHPEPYTDRVGKVGGGWAATWGPWAGWGAAGPLHGGGGWDPRIRGSGIHPTDPVIPWLSMPLT